MSKLTIIEGNSNDKDNVRAIMVKGEKGEKGDNGEITYSDVVDNLTTTSTQYPLSANQGKQLKDLIDIAIEDIDNLNEIVDEELKVNYLSIGDNPVSSTDDRHLGDCIVITGKKNIIIDLGFQTDCSHLIGFLEDNNITSIDAIIISHYHLDHVGGANASGLNTLLNTNIDFSNCIAYLPHKDIDWTKFTGITFENLEITVENILTTKGITYIYPDNEQSIELDENLKLSFYNIGSNFYTDYYDELTVWNLLEGENTIYNNFSMVVLLEHFKNKFLFTADIEPLAQSKLYQYFKDIDVLKVEHHALNYDSDTNYLNQLNPKYAVIGDLDDLTATALTHNSMYNLKQKGTTIFRTTVSGDITITSSYNKLTADSEEAIDLYDVNYSLYEGKPIPPNADLNDYLLPGIYNSITLANTETLSNCPITGSGFKLIVERHTASINTVRQTLLRNNVDSSIYTRSIVGGVYGNWQKVGAGLEFSVTPNDFTAGSFDITYTTSNNESRFECKNNVALLSITFHTNEQITTGTDIFILPTSLTINGETRTLDYGNKIINFNMTDSNGTVYPMYLGGGKNLRARKTIPNNTTIRGNVSFIFD